MKNIFLAIISLFLCVPSLQASDTQQLETPPAETQTNSLTEQQIITAMRDKWRGNFIPATDLDNRSRDKYLLHINKSANHFWETMDKTENIQRLWPDTVLDNNSMSGKTKLGATLYTIYQRLFTLSKAWATTGSDLYHNPQLLHTLTEKLTRLNQDYYNATSAEWGNWWHWELGISRSVNNTLVVLYDNLPAALIDKYNQATRHFVADPRYLAEGSGAPYSTTKNVFTSTGGNRIDSAQVVFVRGLLENNANEISAAVNSLPEVLNLVESGDGFYADGSFIQHKDLPYTGTYGQVLLNGLGLIKNNVAHTPWDFSPQENQRIYAIIENTFLPWLYQGHVSDAVNGRSISRKKEQDQDVGASLINAIALFIDGTTGKEQALFKATVKAQLTTDTLKYYQTHLPESLQAWKAISRIESDAMQHPRPYETGGKLFSDMDRLIYRGNNYQTVIAMHSRRTGSYECINGENLRGQRTSDGMTYLYLPNDDQYSNYWPLVNSQYLAGTTSAGRQGWCDEQYRAGQLGHANINWAGGVILDQLASASMQLKTPASSLHAKKSWFMTPDFIVMLGSHIFSAEPAVTTIANRKISDAAKVFVGNTEFATGKKQVLLTDSITLDDQGKKISWQPLQAQQVVISRKTHHGDWSDIGTSSGKLSADFLTITQANAKQSDRSYSWVIYPNQLVTTASDIKTSDVKILANSSSVQSIIVANKTLYANFWKPAKVNNIRALTPLALIMYPTSQGLRVAVSSPPREQRVSFVLDKNFSLKQPDSRITVKGNTVSVDVSHLRGASYVFELLMNCGDNK